MALSLLGAMRADGRTAAAEMEAVLAGAAPEQLTAPGPDDRWSARDHLAHLVAWQRKVLGIVAKRLIRPG